MLATTCYTRNELTRFLQGRADEELSHAIEGHLESCPRCEDTLSELDSEDDTLIRTLQVKSGDEPSRVLPWVARMADNPDGPAGGPAAANNVAETDPPAELGDYELVGVLGRGGMSVVFAARHKHLGREVALKVLLPTTQQHAVSRDRFAREMRAVGGLDHAAIIRATDAGEFNETLYLVMEQIDGVDLNRISKSEGPLRVADACAIGIDVARGLAHAHEQGVVHRDVKPSNVMLDRNGHVKILDFGLARMQSTVCDVSLQTTMGQLLGTLDYMAPEQASGCDVDARADIYALGATLFKLLAGIPPHGRSAEMPIIEFLNHLATHDAKRLDQQRDQLPAGLVELIASMLQRDPARRIASAQEIAERLQPFAAGADLPALAASAAEKTATSPEHSAAMVTSHWTDVWSSPLRDDAARQEQPPPQPAKGRGRIGAVGWSALATALISFGGLVALTIVLTLKSAEGEIRIESELENVKVEVVDEKDRVDVIAVEHGAAMTTVRAGRYRVRLNSPSDGIEITPRELIVTKGRAVIAKVRKIPAAKPGPVPIDPRRAPSVAMEAQVQLAKTMDDLAAAKQQPKPNAAAIKSLEEKLSRLRALSRPIPTEPVYEGRTLDDWVAQMKFEQESTAKKVAASNVLKLAVTRPDEERMELILDAGSRLLAWDSGTVESRLYDAVVSGRDGRSASWMGITAIERPIAVSHLASALLGDDRRHGDYALWLCAALQDEIQQGKWPGLPEALEAKSQADDGPEKVISRSIYAICLPDAAQAARVMAAIATDQASEKAIPIMMYAAEERKLEIPRATELDWLAAVLDTRPYFNIRRGYPTDLERLWFAPTAGPLRNIDWDQVDASLQADLNHVVGPLLKTFERRLADVDENPRDGRLQLLAAVKADMMTVIVNHTNLTGEVREKAVTLLNRRLEQLLELRATRAEELSDQMDTPASMAVAVMLLTGEVPPSIKQLRWNESGGMAKFLHEARAQLTPKNRVVMLRNTAPGMWGNRNLILADWYPYELLTAFQEFFSLTRESGRDIPGPGGFAQRNSTSFSQLFNNNPTWRIDPHLMLDFGGTSASASEFINEALYDDDFTARLGRHPAFAKTVTELMEGATSQEAAALGYRLWRRSHSAEEGEAKLLAWLRSGDVVHARAALSTLAGMQSEKFLGEWAMLVVAAIDRIAAKEFLNAEELTYLESLADQAPHAADHASKYLNYWLDSPDERDRQYREAQSTFPGRRGRGSPISILKPCLNILLRSPEHAQQVSAKIQKILGDPPIALDAEDRTRLNAFMARVPN